MEMLSQLQLGLGQLSERFERVSATQQPGSGGGLGSSARSPSSQQIVQSPDGGVWACVGGPSASQPSPSEKRAADDAVAEKRRVDAMMMQMQNLSNELAAARAQSAKAEQEAAGWRQEAAGLRGEMAAVMATVVPAVRSLEEEIRNPSPRNSNASPRASTTTPLLLGHPLSPSAPATTPPRQPLSGAPSTPSEGVPFQIPHPLWPAPNPMTPASAATTPSHAYNHNNHLTTSYAASMYSQTPMDAASELLDGGLVTTTAIARVFAPHLFDPAKAYHDKFGGIQAPTGRQLPKSLAAGPH